MDKLTIIEVLKRWNLWGNGFRTGVPRDQTFRIQRFLSSGKVISIWGVRRAGKSYIIRQLIKAVAEEFGDSERTLLIHLEEPEFEGSSLEDLSRIYSAYKEVIRPRGMPFVFLDEVQNVDGWERFARGLLEREEAHIVVSGSSARLLSRELSTSLAGRHLGFEVQPLSFREFLRFRGLEIENGKDQALNAEAIRGLFGEFFRYGAFPEVVNASDEELKHRIIRGYFEDILVRDVLMLHEIRATEKLRSLARFYQGNVSSLMTYQSISRFLHEPVETVRRHTEHFTDSRCLFFIPKFSYSIKEQDNSPRKVYSMDTYLASTANIGAGDDKGRLLENMVATELLRRREGPGPMEFYYWKPPSGGEVDFVITNGSRVKEVFQVCYAIQDPATKEREEGPLLKAMKEFDLRRGTILTFDHSSRVEHGNKTIEMVPVWKWLLGSEQ
jgi:hypothetical protein